MVFSDTFGYVEVTPVDLTGDVCSLWDNNQVAAVFGDAAGH